MPQKDSNLNLDRGNRVKASQWLISPAKRFPRPEMPPGQVEKHYREIKNRSDQLHEECRLSSGKRPRLTGPAEPRAADSDRSGSNSPGSPQGVKTHGPSSAFSREKMEVPGEVCEDLRVKSVETESRRPLRGVPCPEDSPSRTQTVISRGPASVRNTVLSQWERRAGPVQLFQRRQVRAPRAVGRVTTVSLKENQRDYIRSVARRPLGGRRRLCVTGNLQ